MQQKTAALVQAGSFCLFLAGFCAAALLSPDKSFLPNENRVPAPAPSLSVQSVLSGAFTADAEAYVTDSFPLRDAAMALHAGAELTRGKTELDGVYFGTDGALYQRAEEPDAALLAKNAAAVERFAQAVGVPVTLSLLPTAAEIYSDRLPRGAPSANQREIAAAVRAQLDKASYTDCSAALSRSKAAPIFYRTDHHWTSRGAYEGYRALLEGWGMVPHALADYGTPQVVSRDFYGTLARTAGALWLPRDEITCIARPQCAVEIWDTGTPTAGVLYAPEHLQSTDQYRYFLGGSHALVKITGEQRAGERLLVLRDSYADSLAPFLAGDFAEVHLADLRYSKLPMTDYVRAHGIDRVLVLYSVPNFSADTNLAFLR